MNTVRNFRLTFMEILTVQNNLNNITSCQFAKGNFISYF